MSACGTNPCVDLIVAPVAGGKKDLPAARLERHAHLSVKKRTVSDIRLIAEVIFKEIRAIFGKGACIKELMVKAAGVIGACTGAGAGIHAEFKPFGVNIVADRFHSVGEFDLIGDYFAGLGVSLPLAPAVVDDEVIIPCLKQTFLDHCVGGLFDNALVDILAKGIPGVKAHRRGS